MDATPDTQEPFTTESSPVPPVAKMHWQLTILSALAMLLIGITLGYSARPMLDPAPAPTPMVIVVTPALNTAANATTPAATTTTKRATILDAVIAQTRHFKGDPNAPVTLIEFGDFQ